MMNGSEDFVEVNENKYFVGDFVVVQGYSPGIHTRVIRMDKIVKSHLTFVCEYEGDDVLFKVNSVYIERLASIEEIVAERDYRMTSVLTEIFGNSSIELTYEWGKINKATSLSNSNLKPIKRDLYLYEYDNKFCLSLEKDEPWHDGAMASDLNLLYIEYIFILKKFKGIPQANLIKYTAEWLHHSTDTYFDKKEDCENCIRYLSSIMESIKYVKV